MSEASTGRLTAIPVVVNGSHAVAIRLPDSWTKKQANDLAVTIASDANHPLHGDVRRGIDVINHIWSWCLVLDRGFVHEQTDEALAYWQELIDQSPISTPIKGNTHA